MFIELCIRGRQHFALFNYRYLNCCQHLALFFFFLDSFHSPNIDLQLNVLGKLERQLGFNGKRMNGDRTLDSSVGPSLGKPFFSVYHLELSFLTCKPG